MKYDVLRDYRRFLEHLENIRPETARTYTNRLEILLQGQDLFDTTRKLDMNKILNRLSDIKYKNHFSQSKNALLYFLQFENISLSEEQQQKLHELEQKTKKKYRKLKAVDYKDVQRNLNQLKNEKLKLSYKTMIQTGLRVSELSQIKKEECKVSHDFISFLFAGKGGTKESITIQKVEDREFFESLSEYISTVREGKKIFYSANYLQSKALESIGCRCHDLRRISAKLEYKKTRSKEDVQKKLRHTSTKTTNLYLKSKVRGI